jgi:hypothetical protein
MSNESYKRGRADEPLSSNLTGAQSNTKKVYGLHVIYTVKDNTLGNLFPVGTSITIYEMIGRCSGQGEGPFADIIALRDNPIWEPALKKLAEIFKENINHPALEGLSDRYRFNFICEKFGSAVIKTQEELHTAVTKTVGGGKYRQRGGGITDILNWIGGAFKTAFTAPFKLLSMIYTFTKESIVSCARKLANFVYNSQIYQAVSADAFALINAGPGLFGRLDAFLLQKYTALKAKPPSEIILNVIVFTLLCIIPFGVLPGISITGTSLIYNLTTYLISYLPASMQWVAWGWTQYAVILPVGVLEQTFFVELNKLILGTVIDGTQTVKNKVDGLKNEITSENIKIMLDKCLKYVKDIIKDFRTQDANLPNVCASSPASETNTIPTSGNLLNASNNGSGSGEQDDGIGVSNVMTGHPSGASDNSGTSSGNTVGGGRRLRRSHKSRRTLRKRRRFAHRKSRRNSRK